MILFLRSDPWVPWEKETEFTAMENTSLGAYMTWPVERGNRLQWGVSELLQLLPLRPLVCFHVFKCFGSHLVYFNSTICVPFSAFQFHLQTGLVICLATENCAFAAASINKTFMADLIYNSSPALKCPPVYVSIEERCRYCSQCAHCIEDGKTNWVPKLIHTKQWNIICGAYIFISKTLTSNPI